VEQKDISLILLGIGVLIVTCVAFWFCIPNAGKMPRLIANKEVAPYIPVLLIAGIALGISLICSDFVR